MITFDNFPSIYWLIGYVLAGIVILAAFLKKVPPSAFVALAILLLVYMRLPVIVLNRELNPDESQMLSHAITLSQDPVYWRSVDGTTIGPLDNYFLVIPRFFGFQIDYTSGRAMGLISSIMALLLLFFSLRNWFPGQFTRSMWLMPVLFLSFSQEADFVHYSSEQVPVLLLSAAIWLLSLTKENRPNLRTLFFLGLILGLVPFAKLQAVPLAAVVGLAAMWCCVTHFIKTRQLAPFLLLVSGTVSFPALVLIWASWNNVFTDFINFYILGNAIYAGGNEVSIIMQFLKILNLSNDFRAYTLLLGIPLIASFFLLVKHVIKKDKALFVPLLTVSLVLISIYAATKSGNAFVHYLNFCIIPWILFATNGIHTFGNKVVILPLLLLCWFLATDALEFVQGKQPNKYVSVGARTLYQSPVVKELKKFTRPGDYMTVWGWQCAYYVEAQLPQGTAENHSERCIYAHKMRDTYRQRYMKDLHRNRPAIILDAVGKNSFWVQDVKTQNIESYPELAQFVKNGYADMGTFDGTKLYVRKDRLSR
ncbi:hypothetical protein DYBT9275_05081 [Dyadobacter sp. CECT 9275]|uniref:Uncharacterized protein n=1 Tax=Dyadobacter helix TaxID=2822344 RepID=A0A916JJR7_9BACT|nr:hypothetical protein [Dyadobacter sp. CECT 9275]CAG5012024.1 hypothetical protein DYBT9275_05081 [Dyadobacter sp. CECT 9275]